MVSGGVGGGGGGGEERAYGKAAVISFWAVLQIGGLYRGVG